MSEPNEQAGAPQAAEHTDVAPGAITDFASVFMQHNKGREHLDASRGLNEIVEAAIATEKKNGSLTIKVTAEPLDSGAVRLVMSVDVKPAKDPAGSIWFTDGEGKLSRDNAGMFYGTK